MVLGDYGCRTVSIVGFLFCTVHYNNGRTAKGDIVRYCVIARTL